MVETVLIFSDKVKSVKEAYQMLCGSHTYGNLANHMKKQNKKHQNSTPIDEELKTKSQVFFISSFLCDLQGFKS